ncbi:MAG: HAD family hydrolase [Eubacterium sp.]|jgi:putative hydrolase of the HAD superfamily|nr:HAD family hydrolase [Eubacterium sp.]
MSIQNILFDFYGTLAGIHTDESRKELWRCLSVWYQSHGAAYTPLQLRRDYRQSVQEEKRLASARHPQYTALDIRIESVFERLYAGRDVHASSDVIAETALFFRTLSRAHIRLYPGVRAMLARLHKEGRRCYLLTNAQAAFTLPELRLLEISDCFDGCMISSQQECAKPDPHFFQAALDAFGLDKKDTIMAGNDPRTDIAGANAFGIDSVYIHSDLSPEWTGTAGSTYTVLDGDIGKQEKLLLKL